MGTDRTPCPNSSPDCPFFESEGGCFIDSHHTKWPAERYVDANGIKRGVAWAYRELLPHRVEVCRAKHVAIHTAEEPPTLVSQTVMSETVAIALSAGERVEGLSNRERKRLVREFRESSADDGLQKAAPTEFPEGLVVAIQHT